MSTTHEKPPLVIPENIEELIAAHMLALVERLSESIPGLVSIQCDALNPGNGPTSVRWQTYSSQLKFSPFVASSEEAIRDLISKKRTKSQEVEHLRAEAGVLLQRAARLEGGDA